jgi:Domain of unknown function (DUF6265)
MHCLERFPQTADRVPSRKASNASALLFTVILVASSSLAAAQELAIPPHRAAQDTVAPRASALKPTLSNLSWLAGEWQGTWGPRIAQQTWTTPNAGVMLGTFQLTEGDKTLVLEFFTLTEESDGIKLYLRHFTPSLTPWEKPGPTVLNLQSADTKSVVFVNPVDGDPKQDVLTKIDADTYISRSEIVPDKGDAQVTEITYHRVYDGSPPKRKSRQQSGSSK